VANANAHRIVLVKTVIWLSDEKSGQMVCILIVTVNENDYHLFMDNREARALLAGTLALMTHFAESRCPQGAVRISENLLRLCAMREIPWEFRAALAKLGVRWSLLEEAARTSGDPGAARH
jgi:hypothetical protein